MSSSKNRQPEDSIVGYKPNRMASVTNEFSLAFHRTLIAGAISGVLPTTICDQFFSTYLPEIMTICSAKDDVYKRKNNKNNATTPERNTFRSVVSTYYSQMSNPHSMVYKLVQHCLKHCAEEFETIERALLNHHHHRRALEAIVIFRRTCRLLRLQPISVMDKFGTASVFRNEEAVLDATIVGLSSPIKWYDWLEMN